MHLISVDCFVSRNTHFEVFNIVFYDRRVYVYHVNVIRGDADIYIYKTYVSS